MGCLPSIISRFFDDGIPKMRSSRIVLPTLLAAAALLVTGSQANASFQLSLGESNDAIGAYTAPFATVDVTRVSDTQATFTFTALSQGGYDYFFSDGSSVALNLNTGGGTITYSYSSTYPQDAPNLVLSGGGGSNVDGHGTFNFILDNTNNQFSTRMSTVTLTINNTASIWTDDSAASQNILAPNNKDNLAAAHIFVVADGATSAVVTGYAADGDGGPGPQEIPEPASLAAWGLLSLVGVGGLVRRRYAKKS